MRNLTVIHICGSGVQFRLQLPACDGCPSLQVDKCSDIFGNKFDLHECKISRDFVRGGCNWLAQRVPLSCPRLAEHKCRDAAIRKMERSGVIDALVTL